MTRKRKPQKASKTLFAENLRRIIGADKRPLGEIAEALGTDSANLGKYMRGERYPGDKLLDRMVSVLGVAQKDFFDDRA